MNMNVLHAHCDGQPGLRHAAKKYCKETVTLEVRAKISGTFGLSRLGHFLHKGSPRDAHVGPQTVHISGRAVYTFWSLAALVPLELGAYPADGLSDDLQSWLSICPSCM